MLKNNIQGLHMALILLNVIQDGSYDVVVENHIVCVHAMWKDIIGGFYQDGDGSIIMMHV